jgi:hypothetical protein
MADMIVVDCVTNSSVVVTGVVISYPPDPGISTRLANIAAARSALSTASTTTQKIDAVLNYLMA